MSSKIIRFACDYDEGACPEIMAHLAATNLEQNPGYGEDPHCDRARALIRAAIGREDAYVQFLVGGTQTNQTVIAAALRPYQGVLAAATGHINVHETGAIEATGHKVLALPDPEGKVRAEAVDAYVKAHWADPSHEHTVQPRMVYISHPTEGGLLYSLRELEALRQVCDRHGLYLYLDGARLGYGLVSPAADVTIRDIARLVDAFYIGGTKVGALFGEAAVLLHPDLKKDFRYMIKRQGGMLAKGRLLGIQFETLFTDDLYTRIAQNAVDLAMVIRDALRNKGVPFLYESPTNQQFPILPDAVMEKLSDRYAFEGWGRVDETHTATRICTSWATPRENVDALLRDLLPLL